MSSVNPTKLEKDLFTDVSAGICFMQKFNETLDDMRKTKYKLSKVKKYIPKTEIPKIIQNALDNLDKSKFKWKHDIEFISNNNKIKVIKYDNNTFDWCIVNIDGEEKKISKCYLRELWEYKTK